MKIDKISFFKTPKQYIFNYDIYDYETCEPSID